MKNVNTNSAVAQFKELKGEFLMMGEDALRITTATTTAAVRSTTLTMRAAAITVEAVNAGLGYALDHTPRTYEETKEAMSSMMDDMMEWFDDEEVAVEAPEKPKKKAK